MLSDDTKETIGNAIDALMENHKHHYMYDEHGGYYDSDLYHQNVKSLVSLSFKLGMSESMFKQLDRIDKEYAPGT